MAEEQTLATSDSGTQRQFFYDDAPVPRALKAIGRRLKEKNSESPEVNQTSEVNPINGVNGTSDGAHETHSMAPVETK